MSACGKWLTTHVFIFRRFYRKLVATKTNFGCVMDFSRLAEKRIEEAIDAGLFDDLPGCGEPLPKEMLHGDRLEIAGFRMMARAGALPPEILLKKEIATERARLRAADNEEERIICLNSIANLEMRLAMMLESRRAG